MEHAMNAYTRKQWLADISNAQADADSLLNDTAELGARVRARTARRRMVEMLAALLESTREAVRLANTYVHENPWHAMGAATAAGLLLSFLLGSR